MQINIPPVVRFALYIVTALGTPVVEYLRARGVFGALEVALWNSEVAAVAAMAAFNVTFAVVRSLKAADAPAEPAPAADVPVEPPADVPPSVS